MNKKILVLFIITKMTFLFANETSNKIDVEYYKANNNSKNVAIIFLGGSGGGGIPDIYNYESFTKLGYPCLAVSYFGSKNTPPNLEMVPIEYFKEVIKQYTLKPEIVGKKIVVFGTSRGGELALLISSKLAGIDGVIANVPSAFVFRGITKNKVRKSAWSENGRPLDYLNVKTNEEFYTILNSYPNNEEHVIKSIIQVEKIKGPILLISGKNDNIWASTPMCNFIENHLKYNNFKYWYKHVSYENAGHTLALINRPNLGGTPDGNALAKEDSEKQIFDFLLMLN